MAQFGRADTGLIQATAGAEKSQYIDDNMVMGAGVISGVSTAITQFVQNKQSKRKKARDLNAAFDKEYQMPSGSLDTQMEEFLAEEMKAFKQTFLDNQDGSFKSKRALSENQRKFNEYVDGLSDAQGVVDGNRASSVTPNGFDDDDALVAAKFKNRRYLPGKRPNASNGGDEFYFAVPKNDRLKPVFDPNLDTKLVELEAMPIGAMSSGNLDLLKDIKAQKIKFNKELVEWDRVNDLEDKVTVNGVTTYNEQKYDLYNPNEIAKFGGVDESRANMLDHTNTETANFTKNSHFDIMKKPAVFEADIKKRMLEGDKDNKGKIDTRTELNDVLFSDGTPNDNLLVNIAFNEDGTPNEDNPEMVENSYANMFINELTDQSEDSKHSYMYNDENGEPIKWAQEGDEGDLVYGTDEWYSKSKSERSTLLEMKLRGKDELGSRKGTANFDPHQITQYAKFQSIVLSEQREAQKRTHYEKSGLYFDDGSGNPYLAAENKSLTPKQRESEVFNQKEESYTNSIIDLAFGNDKSEMFTNRISTKDGIESIEKVLKAEFKAAGMDIKVKSPGRSIEIEGKEFDFSDPATARETLKSLKQHISDLRDSAVDENGNVNDESFFIKDIFLGGKANSITEWAEEFSTKKNQYYPAEVVESAVPAPTNAETFIENITPNLTIK